MNLLLEINELLNTCRFFEISQSINCLFIEFKLKKKRIVRIMILIPSSTLDTDEPISYRVNQIFFFVTLVTLLKNQLRNHQI